MQILWNSLVTAGILLLAAASFSLPYKITKSFDFSHGILFSAAPFAAWFVFHFLGFSFSLSIVIALVFTTALGTATSAISFRAACNGALGWQVAVGTLGIYVVCQNLLSIFFGDDLRLLWNVDAAPSIELLGALATKQQITLLAVCVISLIVAYALLTLTLYGKMIQAAASNRDLSFIIGLNPYVAHLVAAMLGASLAALCGIMVAVDTGFTPSSGFRILMSAFAIVVIGGAESIFGLVLGALLIASGQHLSVYFIGSKWADSVSFLILIAFLIWKPLGFSGRRLKKIEI